MNPDDPLWQKLNAYVDGELDPASAAEVAARVASDRSTAAAVATLTRLKAATAQAGVAGAPTELTGARPRPRRRWAVAAAVAALAAVGGIWFLLAPEVPDARLTALVERHNVWASETTGEALDSSTAARVLVGLGRFGGSAEIPDLTDAGLQLARISLLDPASGGAGLHIGYIGSRGCRVSLIIEPAPAGNAPARRLTAADMAAWTVDGVAYTLLASGMHPPRFAVIATSAEAATRSHAPLAGPMREAMRGQRDTSPPCVG